MVSIIKTVLDVCGPGWLSILTLVAVINLIVAARLTFVSRSVIGLVSFLPVSLIPLWIGVLGSLFSLTQAIELSVAGESDGLGSNLLIAMALLPFAVGASFCIPAYALAAFGRLWLATRSMASATVKSTNVKGISEAQSLAKADEAAYEQYADMVNTSGHRRNR